MVDVLRASTTLVTLVERGCGPILVAPTVAAARRAAARDSAGGLRPLLIGEEGGLAPAGFDYGNSPVEFTAAPVAGRAVVFASTNGAPALYAAAAAGAVLVGCLRNAGVAARAAWEAAGEAGAITILCAGRAENPGGFTIDDLHTAGVLVHRLTELGPVRPTEWAEVARLVAAAEPDPLPVLRRCAAGQAVIRLGLERDVTYAATVDASDAVPRLGVHLRLTE